MNIKTFILFLCVCLSQHVTAKTFVEGEDYIRINAAPAQVEHGVTEYFSFRCPACFNIEPFIQGMETQLSPMKINRVHVDFGNKESELSQITYALLTILHAEHLAGEIFHRFHRGKGAFRTQGELVEFFHQKGFDRQDITDKVSSFTAKSRINAFNKKVKDNKVSRIPSIIVNNKYQVVNSAINSGDTLADLVSYLNSLP